MQTTKLLNEADYKHRAELILQNLDSVQLDIEKYNKELFLLGEKLDKVNSFPEFFKIVDDVIKTESELDKFLIKEMKGLNQNIRNILIQDIKDKSEFQSFINVLSFNQIITDKILKNKERLSLHLLKEQLPEPKYNLAKNFIHSITVLKPITELIEKQKAHFKTALDSADSMDQVNEIERQIDVQDSDLLEAYQTLINFPEDEQTAEAVINFLEKNQQIKNLMESFDFAESLIDDVLNAKTRVSVFENHGPK
ncbi:hypothetical protein Lsan_1603 [Legionella santicrucis]|uniref:Uncharacterized protein n=1 Tax=Legionella santicrucis TaxID=45074 RepID=A0A0W0Z262_9GAMM|nr:hypothetical protein [Legionella santicrucis]KTD62943.1 hypothetical protein Lsan_1603 [Legionella santicrucis]